MADSSLLAELTANAESDGIQQLVVGAVIQIDGKVLLLRRRENDFMGGIFELPSGKVEQGESLDAALIREVKEETGLDVTAIGRYLGRFDYVGGSGKKTRQVNFVVESASEPIVLREHDTYTWTRLTDLAPVTDAVRDVLNKYRDASST